MLFVMMEKVHYSRREYRDEYLNSPEWREKSRYILDRDKRCMICIQAKATDVHHLCYDRLHNEAEEDLIAVCRPCHNFIHKYRELSKITDRDKLHDAFFLAKQPHYFTRWHLNGLFWEARLLTAGILKYPAGQLEDLIGKRITISQDCKIRALRNRKIALRVKPRKYDKRKPKFLRM